MKAPNPPALFGAALLAVVAVVFTTACDRQPKPTTSPKLESVNDIPTPTEAGPPVQANLYDDGYKAGDLAGETAAKAQKASRPKQRPISVTDSEIEVLALEAAGTQPERGEKWQRGFAAGYKDGFARVAENRR